MFGTGNLRRDRTEIHRDAMVGDTGKTLVPDKYISKDIPDTARYRTGITNDFAVRAQC